MSKITVCLHRIRKLSQFPSAIELGGFADFPQGSVFSFHDKDSVVPSLGDGTPEFIFPDDSGHVDTAPVYDNGAGFFIPAVSRIELDSGTRLSHDILKIDDQ